MTNKDQMLMIRVPTQTQTCLARQLPRRRQVSVFLRWAWVRQLFNLRIAMGSPPVQMRLLLCSPGWTLGNAASAAMLASSIGKEDVLLVTGRAMRIVTATCVNSCHVPSAAVFIWSHMKTQTSALTRRRKTLVAMLVDDWVVGQRLLIAIPGVRATIT